MRAAVVGVGGWTTLCLLACSGVADLGGGSEIALEQQLDDATSAQAVAMLLTIDDLGSLPDETLEDCEAHADRFVWLAATREETREIAAALQGVAGCTAEAHEPDVRAVLDARLEHESPAVVGRALQGVAALAPTLPADDPLLQEVVAIIGTHDEMPVRYEAVSALKEAPWEVASAGVLEALDDASPPVKSEALKSVLAREAPTASAELVQAARILATEDIDPGIRGLAVRAVARLAPDDPASRELAVEALDDEHAYTRAAAAQALGDLGKPVAIHVLVEHLDDPDEARWTMRPWSATDGSEWIQHHGVEPFDRVDDAVLRAIVALTADLGDDGFQYREIDPEYVDLDIIAATRDARRWYDEHQGQLPEG